MRFFHSAAQSCALALIFFLHEYANVVRTKFETSSGKNKNRWIQLRGLRNLIEEHPSAIGRTVINNDDFFFDVDSLNAREDFLDCAAFVVDRNYDRNPRPL